MSMTRLEAVLATIGERAATAEAQLEKAERLAAETDRLRVSGRSRAGEVVAVVDGVGQLVDVTFGTGAAALTPGRLRAAVLEAHATALHGLTDQVARVGTEVYGPGSAAASLVTDSYRRRFGGPAGSGRDD